VSISVEEPVTDAAWAENRVVFATGQGSVKIFEDGNQVASLSEHAGAATALSLHPSGEILASVGTDKSIVFYDLVGQKYAARAYTDAGKFFLAFGIHGLLTSSQLSPLALSILTVTSSPPAPPLAKLSFS
jgi:pre-mRNA-processing factor 19